MCSGLGLVCATRNLYRSIVHVEFPKFQTGIFVEWKVLTVYNVKLSVPAAFLRDWILLGAWYQSSSIYVYLMC